MFKEKMMGSIMNMEPIKVEFEVEKSDAFRELTEGRKKEIMDLFKNPAVRLRMVCCWEASK